MSDKEFQLQFNYSGLDVLPIPMELSVVGGIEVSTVKLSNNVWETSVFYADDTDQVLEQYSSEADARAGHRKYVDEMIVAVAEQE